MLWYLERSYYHRVRVVVLPPCPRQTSVRDAVSLNSQMQSLSDAAWSPDDVILHASPPALSMAS
jgi:hypothetical protein